MVETKLTKAIELAKSDTLCAMNEAVRTPANNPDAFRASYAVYDALQDAIAALDKAMTEARKVTG